jgi:large subunit ribosomal protein L44e
LEPNRNTTQKPIEGLPALPVFSAKKHVEKAEGEGAKKTIGAYQAKVQPIYKGGIVSQRPLENTSGAKAKKYKNAYIISIAKLESDHMNVPKEVRTYCPRCKIHQAHTVDLYKAGKRRALAKGERHHEREKKGYGGQKYPLQREFAKTTKKQTLRVKCKVCGYMRHKDGIRLRKLVIE